MPKYLSVFSESLPGKKALKHFSRGTRLYNAIGTSDDKVEILDTGKKYTVTLEAWSDITGDSVPLCCQNYFCNKEEPRDIVGAHVLTEKATREVRKNDKLYLIPLCRKCNSAGPEKDIVLSEGVNAAVLVWDD